MKKDLGDERDQCDEGGEGIPYYLGLSIKGYPLGDIR